MEGVILLRVARCRWTGATEMIRRLLAMGGLFVNSEEG